MESDRRILIVEDDVVSSALIEKCVRTAGYETICARNGSEALAILADSEVSVVITDVVMPEMDGLDLCRAIRSLSRDDYVYLIIVTVKDSKEDVVKGLEAGADEYLAKPIDQAELIARLNTAKRVLDLECSLKAKLEEIRVLSVTDVLTGVFNRSYFYDQLSRELLRAARYSQDLSLIMCDIDHFKNVNDTWGHLTGDSVLRQFALFCASSIRRGVDWVARFGGEEFIIVLPQTALNGAYRVAERLRASIEQERFDILSGNGITVSFGVTGVGAMEKGSCVTPDMLVEEADACLYRAKREGRNRVDFSVMQSERKN